MIRPVVRSAAAAATLGLSLASIVYVASERRLDRVYPVASHRLTVPLDTTNADLLRKVVVLVSPGCESR